MKFQIARTVTPKRGSSQAIFDILPDGCALRKYVEWATAAYGSPPVYHLASILTVAAFELERRGFYLRRVSDGGKFPLTLWFFFVGDSGTGKSTAINAVQDFATDAWQEGSQEFPEPWLEPDGSIQGIVVALQSFYERGLNTTPCLMYHHEAAQIFNTRESIGEQLCKISDGRTFQSNYRRNQNRKGEDSNADRVINPRVSLLMASTEAQLAPHFRDHHRSGGLFTRVIWLRPTFEKADVQFSQEFRGAASLQAQRGEALVSMVQWFAQLSLLQADSKAFEFTQAAHEYLERKLFFPFREQFEPGANDNMHGVRMRLVEKSRVLAVLLAATRGSCKVEVEDVTRTVDLIQLLLEHAKKMSHFGAGEIFRHVLRVEGIIKGAGERGVFRKSIYSQLRVEKRVMDNIFDTLTDAGKVYQDFEQGGVYVHETTEAGRGARDRHSEREKTEHELAEQTRNFYSR